MYDSCDSSWAGPSSQGHVQSCKAPSPHWRHPCCSFCGLWVHCCRPTPPTIHPSIHPSRASPRLALHPPRQASPPTRPSVHPSSPRAIRDYTPDDHCRARTRTASLSGRSSTINASRYCRPRDPPLPAKHSLPHTHMYYTLHTCVHISMYAHILPHVRLMQVPPPDVQQKQISPNTCIAIQTRYHPRRRHRSSPMHHRWMARSHHHVPARGRGLARPHWPASKQTLRALS